MFCKSCFLVNLLKTEVLYSHSKEYYFWSIFYFKHYFISFNVNELLAVPFVEFIMVGTHVGHLLPEYSHSHKGFVLLIARNLASLLLAFCFPFVYMVDTNEMCPSSILSLGLFQRIIWFLYIYIYILRN